MIERARMRAKEFQSKLSEELRARRDSGALAGPRQRREAKVLRLDEFLRAKRQLLAEAEAKHASWLARVGARLGDEMRFLRNWADNPLQVAAVAPSSKELCQLMARYVEHHRTGVIVELGPGTGAVTKAMLDRGVDPRRLVLIEYSADFCELLRKRFPGVLVVNGNAYALDTVLEGLGNPEVATVISGLPLVQKPLPERQALLSVALERMAPGAPFIQFSYMLSAPVKGLVGCTIASTRWVIGNLPPARVWLYRAQPVAAAA